MQLLDLPHELFLELWDIFEAQTTQETYAQMNALIQTCHYLYDNFNPRLYHTVAHTDSSNTMAMTWAIRHGPITTTEKLLDAGVDIANTDLNFILNMAVKHNRVDAIKLLLHRGFDPNMGNRMQQTALHHAAVCDNVEIARILLDAGANVDSRDCDEYTPLSCAVAKGSANVLTLLLERGASMDVTMEFPGAPLPLAAKKGHAEVVDLLLERGLPVEYGGLDSNDTPLTWAARFGHKMILERLLDAGANMYNVTDHGQTSLHLAVCGGYPEIVRVLLERGMEVDAGDRGGHTALSGACQVGYSTKEAIELLLEYNADLEVRNRHGMTPLASAARQGFTDAIKPLLEKGADSTATDELGCTPLIFATRYGHANVVLALLDDGTPPETWRRQNEEQTEDKPRDYRRSIDIPDSRGRTPLFLATLYGFNEIARILLCRGAAMNIPTCAGRNALAVVSEQRAAEYTCGNESLQPTWQAIDNPSEATIDVDQTHEFSLKAEDDEVVEAWCDRCDAPLSVWDSHFHCDECHSGDYDMCAECLAKGETCHDASHPLFKTRRLDDLWSYNYDDPVHQFAVPEVSRELSELAINE